MTTQLHEATELSPLEQARQDMELRTRTQRVERLHAVVQDRMTRRQLAWSPDAVTDDTEPLVIRHARAFERVLSQMPIAIEAHDLIVGCCLTDGAIVRTSMPAFATAAQRQQAREEGASIGSGLSHKTPYYYDILDRGLTGVVDDVRRRREELAAALTPDREALDLLTAIEMECRTVIRMARRHAELAEAQADGPGLDERRRQELLRIAAVCRRVPEHGARTFHEAVQSFWFVHFALFSTGTKLSCGRLDQFLWPALEGDLSAGRLTPPEAQELVDCLWLRFNDRGQICRENFYLSEDQAAGDDGVRQGGFVVDRAGPTEGQVGHRRRLSYAADAADAINHFGQNILLSGIRPDGGDGTNPLTYLCLNALEKFAFTSPVVTVRLHRDSPAELLSRSAEVLKGGGGMPYVNNDDLLVQAYVDLGVPVEDARDYANSNCWETMIEGKSDQELLRGMNFLLFLELVLRRGESAVLGPLGPDTGDPCAFETFDELMAAWKTQMDTQLQRGIDFIGRGLAEGTLEQSSHGRYRYNPFLSGLTLDCVATGRDVIRGGARYTIWHVMGEAVANAIDAMAAIRQLVFQERSLSMAALLEALEADWADHESLRQRIVARCPKFANDDPAADEIGREMMAWFVERSRHHASRYPDVIFPVSVGTFSWYAKIGKEVAASADGRHHGEAIAANFSPAPGTDRTGPTAAIASHVRMHVQELAAGAPLDLRVSASSLRGAEGTRRLAGLIDAFLAMDGNMLTVTVTDVEELRRALEEPERYRHLRVRMGGWSAYFVMLGEEQQRLHIQRVEHGLA